MIKKMSIVKQFHMILYSILTLAIILSLLCYGAIDHLMTENAASYAQSTAQRFNDEMSFLFKRVDTIFTNLLFDENIEQMMLSPYSEKTPKYISSLQVQFSSYSIMNKDIADIALISPELSWSSLYDAKTLRFFAEEMKDMHDSYCFGLKASPLISNHRKENDYSLVFAQNLYGMHNDRHYGSKLGTIILSLNLDKSAIILSDEDTIPTYFILEDENGHAFSFNCDESITNEILPLCNEEDLKSDLTSHTLETTDYLICFTPLEDTPLIMISALDKHALTAEVTRTTLSIIGITIGALLILAFLMRTLLHNMITPLKEMSGYMEQIKNTEPGEKKTPLHLLGCQEISSLSTSFNDMISTQDELYRKLHKATVSLYESELEKKQAELNFLRSQINPHFLYNSLESISSLSEERGVPEIGEASTALGKLFRYSIKGAAIVPLSQELEIVKAYLTIQKVRYPDKLNIIYSIRDNTLSVSVMKLLLQPFIENAVHHGIEPNIDSCTLYIGSRAENAFLILNVYDDGVGIAPDKLCEIKEMLSNPMCDIDQDENAHIGLKNVMKRLYLQYGSQCSVSIESNIHEGTQISIRIPISDKESDHA